MLVPGVRLEINSLHLGPTDHQPSRMGLCWVQRSGVGSSVFRCFFFSWGKIGGNRLGRHQFHGGVCFSWLGGGGEEEKESQGREWVILSSWSWRRNRFLGRFCGVFDFCGENPERIPKKVTHKSNGYFTNHWPHGVEPCLSTVMEGLHWTAGTTKGSAKLDEIFCCKYLHF